MTTFHSDAWAERLVLDKGSIKLIDVMPHPSTGVSADMAVVNAARVSFLGESKGDVADRKLLRYLIRNRHTSPFEQVVFKFRVRAPLVTWWQWVRHRTWSFNFQSGRYTEFQDNDFYMPREWRRQSASNKQASDGLLPESEARELGFMLTAHCARGYQLYEEALKSGVAREMARLFLPAFGVYYTAVATIDAHNLLGFLRLRDHEHAQHEIRVYAQAIREIVRAVMPWTMEEIDSLGA
jgi:thymidylate synthase (FAD)